MKRWILAAVAALAVGQAGAATTTFSSGPLYLTDKCLSGFDEGCDVSNFGTTWDVYGVVEWAVTFTVNESLLTWVDGLANASWGAVELTSLQTEFDGRGWATRPLKYLYVRDLHMVLDQHMTITGLFLETEYVVNGGKWYFDTANGKSLSMLWVEQSRDRPYRHYQFDNFSDPLRISPVPLPATAPLMGAALIGLGIARRRRG